MKRHISWDSHALHFFRNALAYIAIRSPKNAEKVENSILGIIN